MKAYQGTIFSEDAGLAGAAALMIFRDYFAKNKSKKSVKKLDLSRSSVEKWVSEFWVPKDAKDSKLNDQNRFCVLLRNLIHWRVMNLLWPLVGEYKKEKKQLATATFNDVLVMARDMLRKPENREVREYFRNRYRCFYVDEFQDTDAIQTELLFYLAAGKEEDFVSGDWEKCTPRPGSLFLVGDPKQGIYRFRGADVGIYNLVKKRFEDPKIGRMHVLHFNFRSTKEICDFSRRTFEPPKPSNDPNVPQEKKEGYPLLAGSAYQAQYEDMTAMQKGDGQPRTEDSLSRIVCYNAKPDEDAEAVADFVEAMIRNEVPLTGHGTHPARPAKAEDFMILTYAKKEANLYAKKLRARNIPVLLSGKELFSKTVPTARAVCFLRYLLEPEDPLWILSVLHRCYGVAYQDIRRRQKRAGVKKLNALFRRTDETRSETLLDALAAALLAEQPRDDKLCALCAALEELRRLRRFTQTLPAMTVLEQLFENVGCLWPDCGETLTRRVDYARVQQFLSELRSERERSFTDLARRALELAGDAGKSDDTAASGDKGDTAETADTGTDQNGESKTSVGSGMGDAPNAPLTQRWISLHVLPSCFPRQICSR